MDYLCDIVVITWNRKEIIKSFVESFLDSTSSICKLIIIDNASSDGTVDYLLSLKDTEKCKFKIVLNKENNGFVEGVNQGIKISEAPYVCWANNDLIFYQGWLEEVLSILQKNKTIGAVSPNSNSLGVHPPQGVSLSLFAAELREKYKGIFVEMPFCVGFCLVVKREVIDKIEGLSRDFAPLYFEDTDYSMKVKKAGYLIGIAKAAYVWHQEHSSFKQAKERQKEIFSKNRETFEKKWGKILRVVWIMSSYQEVLDNLSVGIELARCGNYLTFYVKATAIRREDIFKTKATFEHSGVQFKRFDSYIRLIWNIIIKKKKFDLVICKDNFLSRIFRMLGCRTADYPDSALIAAIKKL